VRVAFAVLIQVDGRREDPFLDRLYRTMTLNFGREKLPVGLIKAASQSG